MRELKSVAQSRVADWGHAIELDFEYVDDSKETVKVPFMLASSLMIAINQAAVVAGKAQQAQPGQLISLEVPLIATEVYAGSAMEVSAVVFRFLTTIGTPILISMSPDIGRRAIARLSEALAQLDKPPPSRLS